MEDCLKLIVPAEEPESADKTRIAFTLNVDKNTYNFEILKEDLETVLKFF